MTTPDPDLRERLVTALQAAAVPCDGTDCRETEEACEAAHPVRRPEPWRWIFRIEGSPEGLADVALAVVQPELDIRQAEISRLIGFIERGFDTHMQFGVIGADGVTTMQPCADWCYACKLGLAREAAKQRADMLEEARDLLSSAGHNRAHVDDWPDIIPALRDLVAERDGHRSGREQLRAISREHRAESARYRSAWLSARRRAKAWRGEYVTVAEQRTGWDERYIARALYDQNVRAVHKRNEELVRRLGEEQRKAGQVEAERDELRTVARAAAALLRATADRPSSRAALLAAARAIDELTTKET